MIAALNRRYRESHRDRLKLLDRARYCREKADDPEGLREYGRQRNAAYRARQRQKRIKSGWEPHCPMTAEEKATRLRELARKRYYADPLRWRMAGAVRRVLGGRKLGESWEALVGYDADDLRRHIEKQFVGRMSWENMHEWHVDHIVPLREFDCSKSADFQAAWALSNLRPLWATQNCQKGGKRLMLL